MKLLLLGILLLFFLILITYELFEGFSDNQPKAVASSVRQNNTCSDPDMEYIYDRFDKAIIKKEREPCDANYSQSNYFGIVYCIPNCKTGYTPFSNDTSFCVRTDGKCQLPDSLSNTIEESWGQVCGPLYKTNVNILSTMGSISTVMSTINNQFNVMKTNFAGFSNTVDTYSLNDPIRLTLRSNVFNKNIVSNYVDLNSLRDNINSNFIMMSNKKDRFNLVYNSFDCAKYM